MGDGQQIWVVGGGKLMVAQGWGGGGTGGLVGPVGTGLVVGWGRVNVV